MKKTKLIKILGSSFLLSSLFFCFYVYAQSQCIELYYKVTCARPGGTVVIDYGIPKCGVGQCVMVYNQFKCSPVPGGAAVVSYNLARCEGGCESPSVDYCAKDMRP